MAVALVAPVLVLGLLHVLAKLEVWTLEGGVPAPPATAAPPRRHRDVDPRPPTRGASSHG